MSNVTVYSGRNYGGTAHSLDAGRHEIDPINISSIRVPLGWSARLYSDSGLEGTAVTFTNDTRRMEDAFRTSSIEVTARAAFYQVSAQHSRKSLDVSGAFQGAAPVVQYDWNAQDHQKFLFVRDDDGFYVACARHSGMVLDVALKSYGPLWSEGQVIAHRFNGQDNQNFSVSANRDAWAVEAKHSGKVWDIRGASKSSKASLIEHRWKNGDNQRFYLENAQADRLPVQPGRETNDIVDPPELTSFDLPPARGQQSLIGETWIPYFLIKDGQRSDATKIKQTPFYRISRYGFWKLLYYIDVDAGFEGEYTFGYKEGLTQGNTTTIEKTMNYTVGAEATWATVDKTLGGKFSGSISRTVKVTIVDRVEATVEKSRQEVRTYRPGPRVAEAGWGRADLFILSRMDGTEVIRWETMEPHGSSGGAFKMDRYPEGVVR